MGRWLLGVKFRDSLIGCAVGANGTLIRTVDGGTTWSTPSLPAIGSTFLTDIEFTQWTRAYAVGNNGLILQSLDDGVTCGPSRFQGPAFSSTP